MLKVLLLLKTLPHIDEKNPPIFAIINITTFVNIPSIKPENDISSIKPEDKTRIHNEEFFIKSGDTKSVLFLSLSFSSFNANFFVILLKGS